MVVILGAPLFGADTFTVSGNIILRDESGSGIKIVYVLDRFNFLLQTTEPKECPEIAEVRLERVERDRLPLFIRTGLCNGEAFFPQEAVWTNVGGNETGIPLPGSALLCEDNRVCAEAEATAQHIRNQVLEQCNDVRVKRSQRDAYAAVAATLAAAFVAVLAAAVAAFSIPIFGSAIGAILSGIAAGLAYFSAIQGLRAWQAQQRLDEAEAKLAEERHRFSDISDQVNRLCARNCRTVDLNQPEC